MTEEEYRALKAFEGLPLLNESDPGCESIDRGGHDPAYTGEVVEASDLAQAQQYIATSDLTPKGAIRFDMEDQAGTKRIFAYFWKRRV